MSKITERLAELNERFKQEPYAKHLGAELTELTINHAVVRATAKDDVLVVNGVAQGGFIVSIADFAGVYAAMAALPSGHTPLGSLHMHFLRPVKAGEEIEARGQVINISKRSVLVWVNVYGGEGMRKVKARATCDYAILKKGSS